MAFLTFGTGLGCGIILDNRLLEIPGEAGHWRIAETGPDIYGKRGSWEGYCSGAGLAARAREMAPGGRSSSTADSEITARDVIEAARKGDETAKKIIDDCARYLGRGIAMLVDLFGLERVVLGSLAYRCPDLFLPAARKEMVKEVLPIYASCRILPSALGEELGLVASLCPAIYKIKILGQERDI
jgi:glucokinase